MRLTAIVVSMLTSLTQTACGQEINTTTMNQDEAKNIDTSKVIKSNEDWKKELDPETYYITREKGTERAFTGKYYKHEEEGIYCCSNCGNPLFSSSTKYESGSGWPSFYNVYSGKSVEEHRDVTFGMVRKEVVCMRCNAHLGHVFDDGPDPGGMRYCINSPALKFEKKK